MLKHLCSHYAFKLLPDEILALFITHCSHMTS